MPAGRAARQVAYDLLRELTVQRLTVQQLGQPDPDGAQRVEDVMAEIREPAADADFQVDLELAAAVLDDTAEAAADEQVQAAFGRAASALVEAANPADVHDGVGRAAQEALEEAVAAANPQNRSSHVTGTGTDGDQDTEEADA
jgi:hypothetical protein